MKRTMVLSFILTVVMVAFEAEAQITVYRGKLLNPDRTGPMVITETDQIGRTLKTATEVIGGGLAHIDLSVDQSTEGPTSIDVYDKNGTHVMSCNDWQMVSTEVYSKPPSYSDMFKIVALCTFTPDGELGPMGIGYLTLNGTTLHIYGQPEPAKMTVTGGLGGGVNGSFVFKGLFGSVLKPVN